MRISDWSSDVCSSDLHRPEPERHFVVEAAVGVAAERSGIAEVHPPGVSGKAHATVEVDRPVVDPAGNLVAVTFVCERIVDEERPAERTREIGRAAGMIRGWR